MAYKVASLYAEIGAKLSGLKSGLGQASSQINSFARKAGYNLAKVTHDFDQLGQQAAQIQGLGYAMAGAAAAGGLLIRSSTMVAARNEELANVLETVGSNLGYTTQVLGSYEDRIKKLGITTQSARQSMLQMIQANLDLEHSTDLARLAQDAAVVGMMDSSEAFQTLITVIQRGDTRMARTMGLAVDFAGAYGEMADQLGVAQTELDTQQKLQARLNEVMEAGATISGAYEAAMETAGKQMRSLNRHWEEAQAALGETFLPLLSTAVTTVTDLLKGFNELDPGTKKLVGSLLAVGTVTAGTMGSFILLVPKIASTASAFVELAGTGAAAISTLTGIAAVVAPLVALGMVYVDTLANQEKVSGMWADSLKGVAEETGTTTGVLMAYTHQIRDVQEVLDDVAESGSLFQKAMIDSEEITEDSLRAVGGALMDVSEDYEEYAEAMSIAAREAGLSVNANGDLVRTTTFLGHETEKVVEEAWRANEAMWTEAHTAQILADAQADLATQQAEAAEAARMQAAAQAIVDANVRNLADAVEGRLGKAFEDYAETQARVWGEMGDVNTQIDEQRQLFADGQITAEDYGETMLGLEARYQGLQGELWNVSAAHRETVAGIIYDMLTARLALNEWTEDEYEFALQIARDMGLIDQTTYETAMSMDEAIGKFVDGNMQGARQEINDLHTDLLGIPRNFTIDFDFEYHAQVPEGPIGDFINQHGGSGMLGYQHGTPYVPETGVALLHKGEMVIPQEVAAGLRASMGGMVGIQGPPPLVDYAPPVSIPGPPPIVEPALPAPSVPTGGGGGCPTIIIHFHDEVTIRDDSDIDKLADSIASRTELRSALTSRGGPIGGCTV